MGQTVKVHQLHSLGIDHDKVRFETALSLGADYVINIDKQDPLEAIKEYTDGRGADIVVETANSPKATELAVKIAAIHGRVTLFGLYPSAEISPLLITRKALIIYGDVGQVTRQFRRSVSWLSTRKINVSKLVKYRFGLSQAKEAFEAAYKGEVPKVVFEL